MTETVTLTLVPWDEGTTVYAYPRRSEQMLPDLPPTGVAAVDNDVVLAKELTFDVEPGPYWAVAPLTAGERDYRYLSFNVEQPVTEIPGPPGQTGPSGGSGPPGPPGLEGPQGPTGATGPPGPFGPQGPRGPAGAQGQTGDAGAQGPQGTGINYLGFVADHASLPAGGANGDAYTAQDTGRMWVWNTSANAWVDAGQTQGPQGIQGPQGPQGVQGPQGAQGPQGDPGAKGDTGDVGAQGLKGDKGDPGAQGAAGAQGPKGDQGIQGAPGVQGPQGVQGVQGAVGPAGPVPDIHALSTADGAVTLINNGTWSRMPVGALDITASAGPPDFVRNADGSVTVKTAGTYMFVATTWIDANPLAGERLQQNMSITVKAGDVTPTEADTVIGGVRTTQASASWASPAVQASGIRRCAVNDRVAVFQLQVSTPTVTNRNGHCASFQAARLAA